ncbi:hypothetical protein BDR06DRAFT_1072320 [Suillus hirtellus]|nr:hypothetical protein BDR06DRAFT_1072320 [Suillus hirtellus]
MSHSYRDVFQTFPAYRKGSPPVTSDADRSLEFPRRHSSQYRSKLKCQSASQTTDVKSDSDKETSSLPLVWVEVRDNVIPPHAVPFASDSHGPLFIARAYLEGAFFLGKAGPQLTSGAIISYGSLEITVTRYDVLVCAGRLSWEIPCSSGTSFMRQDTVITKYHINHGLEQALTYHQNIPENAYNSADNYNKVDDNQRSATPDPDPAIVASHTRARSYSTYGLSSKESLDVDTLKAHNTFVPLKSPLELTERSRSLPPRARRSAESSFDARAELGTFRCDSAQSAGVTTVITSATHRSEHAPVSRPNVVMSSKPQDLTGYLANERGTPVSSFGGSEITEFRGVVNVDGWSAYSNSHREPPVQSIHAGYAQDVLPRRRYSNTGIAPSTPVNHHTNQFLSTLATSHSLASNVLDSRFTNTPNPSSKDDSQFTPTHHSFSSHKVLSDSPLSQPSTVFSRGTWAGTQGSLALCLCILDDVKDTSKHQSKLVNCPVHPPADTIGISANLSDFGHVDQYNQWASPIAKTHVWERGMQHQKSHLKDSPSHVPQSPTFLSTDSPPAQDSLVGDHTDINLRSTHYSRHDVQRRPAETSSEDENMTVSEHVCGCESEHVCDSEHWQLVSRTTFGVEAQTCDGTGSDVFTSERPAPITINPSNAGIVTSEVKLLPHPMLLITSASQVAGDRKREHSSAVVQESTLERELVQENRVAVSAVSRTIGTGESTSVVPSRGTPVTEECAPSSTFTCSPNSPPSQRPSAQTISCNDGSVTDDELHSLRECADSSVLACASLAHEENNNSTRVIAFESTQKTSPASNDIRKSSFVQSTLTIVESPSLASHRHKEPYNQDVARDKPSQVTPASKLEEDCKRQTVGGRENHYDQGAESEVKQNSTSDSRTVSVVEGNTSKSAVLNDDRTINEGANGTALSLSINPGSKMSPSEPGVPQDSMINRIESEYKHQSLDLGTVSRNSIHISSHDSTESSEEHMQRQSAPNLSLRNEQFTDDELNRAREEVDSSVLVRSSLIPAENIGAPAPAPHRALDNTRKSSLAYNDLGNSSPTESTSRMGQTSSPVIDLKDGSCGQIVGTELPTHSFSMPVSADYMPQDLEGRGDYHAREVESEVTLKSESYFTAVESVRQSESTMVLNAGGRSEKDANNDVSSLSSTYAERKLSLSEPNVPQDAGFNPIRSSREHQSSEINVALDDELYRHCECTDSSAIVCSSVAHEENDTSTRVIAVESTQKSSPASNDIQNSSFVPSTSTLAESSSLASDGHEELYDQDVARDKSSQVSPIPKLEGEMESYSSAVESIRQSESAMVLDAGGRSEKDANSDLSSLSLTYAERKLSSSESGLPQDAGINVTQSAHEYQSSDVGVASATSVQTLGRHVIEHRVQSSLVTIQERPSFQYVAIDEPCQQLSAPNIDSNKPSECVHQAVESKGDRHELETESKFNLSLTADSHSVGIVERSTSKTVVSKIHGPMDQNTNAPAFHLSQMTTLPPSDPGIPQDAEAELIQSECEHQSSTGVDAASIDLVQTSNYDCSTEIQEYRSAQLFSCNNEPGATLSTHVYLSLEQNNPNSLPSIDKAVENMQESSSANGISKSLASTTYQSRSLVASTHEKFCGQDMTKDQPNQGPSSPKYEADEEGVTADRMHQAIIELRCESQSSDVNEVSKTFESEHTWLSLSEPGVPQDAGINFIQSGREHQTSEINVASKTFVRTSSHCSIENRVHSSLATVQEGPWCQPRQSVGMLGRSTSDTVTANNDSRMDKDAEDTAFPLSSTTIRSKLSIAEPDILHDVATSSKVITTLTDSMQTSSYRSTVNNEHVYQQPAQTSSWSNESPVNQSQTTTPVHLFSVPGENNPTSAQPFIVASSKNTQQPSPAFNSSDSSLPEGVPTAGQTSSPATCERGEPCGRDEARDLPSQGSSTPKPRDDKEDISAYCTFQGIVSNEGDHPAPCAEGTPGVKAREDHCLKAGPTGTSMTAGHVQARRLMIVPQPMDSSHKLLLSIAHMNVLRLWTPHQSNRAVLNLMDLLQSPVMTSSRNRVQAIVVLHHALKEPQV